MPPSTEAGEPGSLIVSVRKELGSFRVEAAFSGPARGVTALFGASGAGKSSLVGMLAGLIRPDAGHIRLGGRTLFDAAQRIDLPPSRRRLGYVFQDARLFPHLSVEANLRYGWRRAPAGERAIDFGHTVDLLGIGNLLHRRPAPLSGGERQRVALGRALLAQPHLLLMDEPLASLDGPRKADILPYIERLRDELKLPIVYVSHAIEEVVRLADVLVVLDRGQVAAAGPVEEVMAQLDLAPADHAFEAGAVIPARVSLHEDAEALSRLDFDGGTLWVARLAKPLGAVVRVRVRASDVLLSTVPPQQTSALNVLEGVIAALRPADDGQVAVRLEVGAAHLVARITRRSCAALALAPGRTVWAVIKSVAIDRRSFAENGTAG